MGLIVPVGVRRLERIRAENASRRAPIARSFYRFELGAQIGDIRGYGLIRAGHVVLQSRIILLMPMLILLVSLAPFFHLSLLCSELNRMFEISGYRQNL